MSDAKIAMDLHNAKLDDLQPNVRELMEHNRKANEDIQQIDELLASHEHNMAQLKAERIARVAVAEFTMKLAMKHTKEFSK